MNREVRKIIVVLGPTSSGKSDLAVTLAKKYNGEIISADSRQIYKYLNLGTGKVEGTWKKNGSRQGFVFKNISHYLIDFAELNQDYNISHFKKDCEKIINKIIAEGKVPIICGGTGFWIQSVAYDQILPEVKPNKKLREKLKNRTSKELLDILKKLDLKRVRAIDIKNKVRLIRAIEIASRLGKVPPLRKGDYKIVKRDGLKIIQLKKNKKIWEFFQIGISFPKDELKERIKLRLESRFEEGMIKEVKNLKEKHNLSWKRIESFGLAYFWIPKFLKGDIKKKELRERVFWAECQYAKRQMTWFKKDQGINWIKNDKILSAASLFLRNKRLKRKIIKIKKT